MAAINNAYIFKEEELLFVYTLMDDKSFTFKEWSSPHLAALRKSIRDYYRNEQRGICSYCRKDVSLQSANNCHVEHIAPKSLYRNFIFEPKNLCVICADCSEIKKRQEVMHEVKDTVVGGRQRKQYPRSTTAFKIVHPHFDVYDDHILILADYFYVNKTEKGIFTIGTCKLNRKLSKFGWPPQLIDEAELVKTVTAFLKEKSSLKRATLIKKLQHQLVVV